jgi:hypothetical protein
VRALLKILPLAALLALPVKSFACAACYNGQADSSMTEGMNWGIFTLMGVIVPVLGGFLAFFIYLIRKGEAAAMQAVPPNDSPKV